MRKIFFLSLSMVWGLFFAMPALAVVQQPLYDTVSPALIGSDFLGGTNHKQFFISLPLETPTTTITSITVRLKTDKTCGTKIKLANNVAGTLNSNNVTTTAGVEQNYTFTWTSNPNFHTGNLTNFSFDSGNSIGGCTLTADHSGYVYGSATTSSYPNGYWYTGTSTPANLFFIINGTSTASFINFAGYPTSTCDFYIWPTQSYYSPADEAAHPEGMADVVLWGQEDPFGLSFIDWQDCANSHIGGSFVLGTASSTCLVPSGAPAGYSGYGGVRKSAPLVPGYVYTATPVIMGIDDASYVVDNWQNGNVSYNSALESSREIASGATWEFIISGQPNVNGCSPISTIFPNFTWPFQTTTFDNPYGSDWCADMPETTTVQEIKKAGCQAAQYLFRPSEDSLNNFYSLKDQLQNKPPFGYFAVYNSSLSGLNNASSTTSTLSTVTSTASLQLSTWTGLSVFATIRTAFEWLFYLLTGLYLFHRFKNFSLHG